MGRTTYKGKSGECRSYGYTNTANHTEGNKMDAATWTRIMKVLDHRAGRIEATHGVVNGKYRRALDQMERHLGRPVRFPFGDVHLCDVED